MLGCHQHEHMRMAFCVQGCEDVSACMEGLLGNEGPPTVLFGLYDGHCGRGAAAEAAEALPAQLRARLAGSELAAGGGQADAWAEAFLATDAGLRSEEGCTATALLAWADANGAVCLQVRPPHRGRHLWPVMAFGSSITCGNW